jgi:hypothetical protein
MISMLSSIPLDTTEVDDALVVWVASTTVGAERARLVGLQHKARDVFGVYADSRSSAQPVADQLAALAGLPDSATLIPTPHRFGATHASKLLPRGARAIGWLEVDGYRSVAGTPQPTREWLEDARAGLGSQAA